ncbi:MAG: divalent metal cation transporter, partial [Saprospiraceae bacterium]|nr:divalent metal cation transporter [Saprospiraceae bacterium]
MSDSYLRQQGLEAPPPKTLWTSLKYLGPGFILSASIVGSGELIATTTLGARAGFVTFWIIIVSCLIKVAVQIEFGRFT